MQYLKNQLTIYISFITSTTANTPHNHLQWYQVLYILWRMLAARSMWDIYEGWGAMEISGDPTTDKACSWHFVVRVAIVSMLWSRDVRTSASSLPLIKKFSSADAFVFHAKGAFTRNRPKRLKACLFVLMPISLEEKSAKFVCSNYALFLQVKSV